MNGRLIVVLQKSDSINDMLEQELLRNDPQVIPYVFFTTSPIVAQQACDDGAHALICCNHPETEYGAEELAIRCRMENSELIVITYSSCELPELLNPCVCPDGHIDKSNLIKRGNVLSVVEIIAGLARGIMLEVLAEKYPDTLKLYETRQKHTYTAVH